MDLDDVLIGHYQLQPIGVLVETMAAGMSRHVQVTQL